MRDQPHISRRGITAVLPLAGLMISSAASDSSAAPSSDPVFAQIQLHKALRARVNTMPGEDDDPAYIAAQVDEEAAIQALGDMRPASIAGAIAQLVYMAEVEGDFADEGSPLLRTVRSVARGLASFSSSPS